MLTALAFSSSIGIFLSYVYATNNPKYYLVAAFLYFVHWFGDSLDGTLARYRKIERPRYGHYIDHMLDSISVVLILGGLTLSFASETSIWMWVAMGILLHFIHGFLKASVTNEFVLAVESIKIGPTEARIVGSLFSIFLYLFNHLLSINFEISYLGKAVRLSLLDVIGYFTVIIIYLTLIFEISKTAIELNRMDRKENPIEKRKAAGTKTPYA